MNPKKIYNSGAVTKTKSQTDNFTAYQAVNNIRGMGTDSSGAVYAVGINGTPSYKKPFGSSTFVTYDTPAGTNWESICGTPNGDIYIGATFIYKRTGGVGNWVQVQTISGSWIGLYSTPNGNIYASKYNDGLYLSTNSGSTWTKIHTQSNIIGITSLNNNIYFSVNGGNIYMQTNATGSFVSLNQTVRAYFGMASDGKNVYVEAQNGVIYKQTNGTGDFVAITSPTTNWYGMTCELFTGDLYAGSTTQIYKSPVVETLKPITDINNDNFILELNDGKQWTAFAGAKNGDIYGSTYQGIYVQTGGVGAFTQIDSFVNVQRVRIAPNSDVYIAIYGGDIYKQTGGVGSFVAQGAGNKNWYGLAIPPNGDVYACELNGAIYKQTGGVGAFNVYNATVRAYADMDAHRSGDVYVGVNNGALYKLDFSGGLITVDATTRFYDGISFCGDDLYIVESNFGIKIQRNRTGAFTSIPFATTLVGMGVATNNNIYLAGLGNGFYKSIAKSK